MQHVVGLGKWYNGIARTGDRGQSRGFLSRVPELYALHSVGNTWPCGKQNKRSNEPGNERETETSNTERKCWRRRGGMVLLLKGVFRGVCVGGDTHNGPCKLQKPHGKKERRGKHTLTLAEWVENKSLSLDQRQRHYLSAEHAVCSAYCHSQCDNTCHSCIVASTSFPRTRTTISTVGQVRWRGRGATVARPLWAG